MEKEFYDAVNGGKVEEVKEILRSNPNLKINWKNEKDDDYTALIIACENGHDSIVRILLAHPDINVNVKNGSGYTLQYCTCVWKDLLCSTSTSRFKGQPK